MTWEIINVIGTLAFAISGALVAMEENFDIVGMLVLSFITAYGGSTIRNLLIGIPIEEGPIWTQSYLVMSVFIIVILLFFLPYRWWVKYYGMWGIFFDAIGLSSFAIQGANNALQIDAPLSAVIVAATLTGAGGGMIRDVFANKKPMIFRKEIYALWAAFGGLIIGIGFVQGALSTWILFIGIIVFRLCSVYYGWTLPRRKLS